MYFFAKNTVSITLFLGSGNKHIYITFQKRISKEALWATITFVCKMLKIKVIPLQSSVHLKHDNW